LGDIHFLNNQFKEAIVRYDQAIVADGSDAIIWNNRGKAKLNLEDFKGAITDFDKAIQIKSDYTRAYLNRGTARFRMEQYAATIEDLEKAKANEGVDAELWRMLGVSAYLTGKKELAYESLEKWVQTGARNGKALLYLGLLTAERNDSKRTVEYLTWAEKEGEKDVQLYETRGKMFFQDQQFEKCIADLLIAKQHTKLGLTSYEQLALAYLALKKEDDAVDYLETAFQMQSKNQTILFELGNARFKKSDFTGAVSVYDQAIGAGLNNEVVFNNRGKAKLKAGLVKESIVDFDRALGIKSDYVTALRNRATANYALNDFPAAIRDFAMIISKNEATAEDLF